MSDLVKVSKAEIVKLARACFVDPVMFCQTFLGHLFPNRIPWIHRGLLAVLTEQTEFLLKYGELDKIVRNFVYEDSAGEIRPIFGYDEDGHLVMYWRQYIELMLPRSFSKTTYAGIAVPIYKTVYQRTQFSVYCSEAGEHASMQLENIRRELAENERIIQVFGDLKPSLRDEERWSAKMFETKTGVTFVARGRGAQVRGLNHRGIRPQEIIVDDVEDKESVSTEDQRKKTRTWFKGDVEPALPTIGKGRIVLIGTMLHREALLPKMAEDPNWTVIKFGVKDRDGDYIWPEACDAKKDEARKKSYALAGELGTYYMEYYNEPRSEETAKFRKEWFKYGDVLPGEVIVAAATYNDPAISKKETADEAVTITVLQTSTGKIYVTDGWGKRGPTADEILEEFFRQHKVRSGPNHASFAGIEANAYQAALVHTCRQWMFKNGYYFNLDGVTHTRKKSERIIGILQPRFQNGFITFTRSFPSLEAQLLDYRPDSDQHDDWPDALAGAIELLDPAAAYYGKDQEPEEDEEEGDDPYNEKHIPDLYKEIGGSWEVA